MTDRAEIAEDIIITLQDDEEIPEGHIEECERLIEENYKKSDLPPYDIKLQHINIENFRVIEEREIYFSENNTVLYGPNESGKTTVLEAIRFNILGRQEKQRIELTDPIRDVDTGSLTLETTGNWSVDNDHYLLYRNLSRNGGYSSQIKLNTKPESFDHIPFSGGNTQQDVSEEFGMWPIERRELGRYNIFSLFSLMPDDYKAFLRWQKRDALIDILFGIDLAAVVEASKKRRQEKYQLEGIEEDAKQHLEEAKNRRETLTSKKQELEYDLEQVETELSDKQQELRRIEDIVEDDNEVDQLKSKKRQVERQRDKLQAERREKRSKLRDTRLQLERLEEVNSGDDFIEMAEALQKFTSVPDRCPVCTNEVDKEQRTRLLEDAHCPLCAKDVPHNRIEIGTERDIEEQILEREKQKEQIDNNEAKEEELENQIEILDSRIADYEEEIERLEGQIEDSDERHFVSRRDQLEDEVDELDRRATSLQVEINAKIEEIDDVEDRIIELEDAVETQEKKFSYQESLRTFEKVVNNKIQQERSEVKTSFQKRMNSLLSYFESGTLSDVSSVTFSGNRGYDFTMHVDGGDDIPSDRQNQNSNEGKMIALIFHTAVLQELSQLEYTFPLRMLMIDSPYSKAPDKNNIPDITNFLAALPEELEDFQIILTIADSDMADKADFEAGYNVKSLNDSTDE